MALGTDHKVLTGAVAAAIHGFAVAAASGDAGENRDKKKRRGSEKRAGEIDFVGGEEFFDLHNF